MTVHGNGSPKEIEECFFFTIMDRLDDHMGSIDEVWVCPKAG